jgi:hypothetical protein
MRRPARQREAIAAVALLLSVLGLEGADAADAKLVTKCDPVARAAEAATLTCDVRAAGFAVMKDVKAKIKGQDGDLETKFQAFDPSVQGSTTAYLIQILPNARRSTLAQMGDAVVTFTDQRDGKRRFTAYAFANDLNLVSDSGASKNEFVRQVIAIKPASTTVQLYKSALKAIEALAKETGDRKSLVILADGTSDDTGYGHDQVVKAARDAGVTIDVLGYYDDRADRPKFQKLSRLAEDTGGYATEVKQGSGKDFTKDVVTSRFVGEVLENGGIAKVTLKGPAGAQTVVFTANLSDGQTVTADEKVEIPAPPPAYDAPANDRGFVPEPPKPVGMLDGLLDWAGDNAILLAGLGALLGLGVIGFFFYGRPPGPAEVGGGRGELLRDAEGQPVVYGWLEMLDGNASRHPLQTTNVRVGRHRDNDICLQNDSISRRHAVLHYNADTRRFVITDLGGGNGVVVNKTKYKSRELNDGDMVELGEVRLRFRAEQEYIA